MSARSRRNARLVAALAVVGALELANAALASAPDPRIVRADFGASAIVVAVISILGNLFGSMKGKVDANVKRVFDGIGRAIVELGKKIVDGAVIVAWQIARLWDWLKKWFGRIFRELADVIAAVVQRLVRVLDRVLGPVIDFLDKVRKHVWAIYNNIVRPILDVIEFLRIPLRILSRFGVDWAKRLDAELAEIEDFIAEGFRLVIGRLNQAIDLLNDIVDVNGLLKRFALVRSIMRDVRYINQVLLMSRFKTDDPVSIANRRLRLNERTLLDVERDTAAILLTGDGAYGPIVREMSAQWRMYIEQASG